ncbi:MAG: hypothetical protein PHS93_10045 [Candidatus Omnitrophica bacterium]|nr:hypothetical protein [Candidatus Omnitrophota bacterium]
MNKEQAKQKIEEAGGSWDVFRRWMGGQTVGMNEDGTINYYDYDVNRFIEYKCNPDNEPLEEFD